MRLLVVDDSMVMRRMLLDALRRIGFSDFVEARDGAEALTLFDASIGFVITDRIMPRMSGDDFVRALRQREDGRRVPVIMVTASGGREGDPGCCGVDDIIVKPFTQEALKDKMLHLLGAMQEIA